MVKIPKSGVSYQFLFERDPRPRGTDVTLTEIVAKLGLKPLSPEAERDIRDRLGFALGRWQPPPATSDLADVISSLNSHAKALEKFNTVAQVSKGGHLEGECLERDMEVCFQLTQEIRDYLKLEDTDAAHAYLADFADRSAAVSSAARAAAKRLKANQRHRWQISIRMVRRLHSGIASPLQGKRDRSEGRDRSVFTCACRRSRKSGNGL